MPCPGLQKKINDGVSKNIILSEDFLGSKIYLKLKYKHTVSEAFRDSTVSFSSSIQSYIIIISYIIKKRNAYLCSIIMSMSRHTARWGGAPRRNHKPVWESILMRILLSSLTWDLLSHDTGICLVWYLVCVTPEPPSVWQAGTFSERVYESYVTPCSLTLNSADESPINLLGTIPVDT